MEAIKAGDSVKAQQAATVHMENAYDNIVKNGWYDIYKKED